MKDLIPTDVPAEQEERYQGPIDWEKAFKVLCCCLAREWISSTKLYFVLLGVKQALGEDDPATLEVLRTAVEHMTLNRDKGVQDFMG